MFILLRKLMVSHLSRRSACLSFDAFGIILAQNLSVDSHEFAETSSKLPGDYSTALECLEYVIRNVSVVPSLIP